MELHPAVAFGAALGGAAVLGAVGAILALPAAAMAQALAGDWGERHDVIDNPLTRMPERRPRMSRKMRRAAQLAAAPPPAADPPAGGPDEPI